MDYGNNKEFDDLEPRVTPQPTILQCMTRPSVPEVSLIFGNKSSTPQLLEKSGNRPEEEYETYANWRRNGLFSAIKPKQDPKYLDLVLANRSSGRENIVLKSTASNDFIKFNETGNSETNDKQVENEIPIEPRQNTNIETHNYYSVAVARNNSFENTRLHRCKHSSRDETCVTSFRKNKSLETPIKNGSPDAIKSILKNTHSDRNELANSKSDRNANTELFSGRKCPSGSPVNQSSRRIEESDYSRLFAIPRCGHQNEVNHDHDTVRELLLLVQDQNKQIKSLQTQVERLLQTQEQNVGYNENHRSMTKKLCDKLSSPDDPREIDKLRNNVISTQNTCQHRGTMNVPPHASNNQTDVHLRYQGDQLRNTILEKKVSIGVMTSFEFSVHNNPFVPDSDSQINAVLRECGKNMSESGEAWRTNMHSSRSIVPGPLENINEDSESHPSSIWKQSSNNTQVSSCDKASLSRINPVANENQECSEDVIRCSSASESAKRKSNAESPFSVLFNKTSCPPVAAPRNFSSSNVKTKRLPQLLKRSPINIDGAEISAVTNGGEQESFDVHRADDENNSEQATEIESCEYPYLEFNDRSPRRSDRLDLNRKTIPTDNTDENSITLRSSDLRVTDRSPPSPDPSIHVEMREYSSDDDNEKSKLAPPVGWTFYKNVVGQVNRILHTIPDNQDAEANETINPFSCQKEHNGCEEVIDSVKLATLERLKMLGISYAEHSEFNGEHVQKKVTFDSSYYPRVDYQTTIPQSTTTIAESNTSMHMKALALKYLSDEQLADLAVQRHGNGSAVKHKVLNSMHGTNMSLATMNYLQRYCLSSGMNTPHTEAKGHLGTIRQKKLKHVVMTKELLTQSMTRQHAYNNSVNNSAPDNILDITTLKQQPKLL